MAKKRMSLAERNRTFIEQEEAAPHEVPEQPAQAPAPAPASLPARSAASAPASAQVEAEARPSTPEPTPAPSTTAPTPPKATGGKRKTTPAGATTPSKPAPKAGEGTRSDAATPGGVVIYLPDDLIKPLKVYRTGQGMTNTQVALRALNAYYTRIDELLAEENQPQIVPGALFDEVQPTPSVSKRQVEIRPTGAQLEVIDQTREASQAPDRSHMFALVIRQLLLDAGELH